MNQEDAYQLSRIHAEGWNAAREFLSDSLHDLDDSKIKALSPHKADPERARWMMGFRSAVKV